MDEELLEMIAWIVREEATRLGVRVEKIILFGSRARGDHRVGSDWDILVVVGNETDWRRKRRLSLRIRRRLYSLLQAPLDILIYRESEIAWRARVKGGFENQVLEGGVVIG